MAILQADESGFILWLGVLCSTWSAMSRGSTFRSWLWPLGHETLECVSQGNIMVGRLGKHLAEAFTHNISQYI